MTILCIENVIFIGANEPVTAHRQVNRVTDFLDRSPLPSYIDVPHVLGYPILSDVYMFHVGIETPGYNGSSVRRASYLSFAPPEVNLLHFPFLFK